MIPTMIKVLMIGQSVVVMARDIATMRINYHTCFLCRGQEATAVVPHHVHHVAAHRGPKYAHSVSEDVSHL